MSHNHGGGADTTGMPYIKGNMHMAFHTNIHTTLLFANWTPQTQGQYTGAVVFLIILGCLYRFLTAMLSLLEARFRQTNRARVVVIAGKNGDEYATANPNLNPRSQWSVPWRYSQDLPRALMTTLIALVAYVLMLAVMTFNVGFLFAVLAGYFLGELAFGRFSASGREDHIVVTDNSDLPPPKLA